MQRCLNSSGKLERNQRTLVALAAGLTSKTPGQERNTPTASRVRQFADELRRGGSGQILRTALSRTRIPILAMRRSYQFCVMTSATPTMTAITAVCASSLPNFWAIGFLLSVFSTSYVQARAIRPCKSTVRAICRWARNMVSWI